MKTCTNCNQTLHVGRFNRNRTSKDGRDYSCSDCQRARSRELFNRPGYGSLRNAIGRCNNKSARAYEHYGGKGITFELPHDYERFWEIAEPWYNQALELYGHDVPLEIERINSAENYTETNTRFVPRIENANNKKSNRKLYFKDVALTIAQWSRLTGLKYSTITTRLARGWTISQALLTKPNQQRVDSSSLNVMTS